MVEIDIFFNIDEHHNKGFQIVFSQINSVALFYKSPKLLFSYEKNNAKNINDYENNHKNNLF